MIEAFLWRENTARTLLLLISFRRGPGSVQLHDNETFYTMPLVYAYKPR